MKTKISKILGVVLTVAMLSSLMMFVTPTPVSAQTNNVWTPYRTPGYGPAGGWALATDSTNMTAGPIGRAIDGTLYCFAYPDVIAPAPQPTSHLFKSTDGGHTWSCTGFPLDPPPAGPPIYVGIDIACSRSQANVLYVAVNTGPATNCTVWKSDNAGASWTQLANMAPFTGTATIRDIDCYEMTEGLYMVLAAGLGDDTAPALVEDVFVYDETDTFPFWQDQGFNPWQVGTWGGAGTVLAASFSPTFILLSDRQILAVASGVNYDGAGGGDTAIFNRYGGATWCQSVNYGTLQSGFSATGACIAFPDDYNSNPIGGLFNVFVGTSFGGANLGDVFWFLGTPGPPASIGDRIYDLDVRGPATTVDINSIAVAGSGGSPMIVAAGTLRTPPVTGSIVYYYQGGMWMPIAKQPAGVGPAWVVIAPDFATTGEAWIAVRGANGGVSHTIGCACLSWDGFGLLDTTINQISDLSIIGGTVYFCSDDGAATDSLWMNEGSGWARVLTNTIFPAPWLVGITGFDRVEQSPNYATDNTLFLINVGQRFVLVSSNGSLTFAPTPGSIAAGNFLQSIKARSATEIILGGQNVATLFRTTTGGLIWQATPIGGATPPIISIADSPATGDAASAIGDAVGDVFITTDGMNFALAGAGAVVAGEDAYVTFDNNYATNGYLYATFTNAGAGGRVYRWAAGPTWTMIDVVGLPAAPAFWAVQAAKGTGVRGTELGIVVSNDGTLYVNDDSAAGAGMCRALDPAAPVTPGSPFTEEINDIAGGGVIGVNLFGMWLDEYGDANDLYAIGQNPGTLLGDSIWYYNDLLAVNLAGGTAVAKDTTADLSWTALPAARQYEVYCNTDPSFLGLAQIFVSTAGSPGLPLLNSDTATGLNVGTTYYWRARVLAQSPCRSRFNDPVYNLTTELPMVTIDRDFWAPSINQTQVPLNPGFTWIDVFAIFDIEPGLYDFQLSYDNNFTDLIVDTQVEHSVYQLDFNLDYGTFYWWRVRAHKGTAVADWAIGMFKTMDEPGAPVYTCGTCGLEFASEAELEAHFDTVHGAPAAETPVYIWVIIAIGAVLIITVIVLIARTRGAG